MMALTKPDIRPWGISPTWAATSEPAAITPTPRVPTAKARGEGWGKEERKRRDYFHFYLVEKPNLITLQSTQSALFCSCLTRNGYSLKC
jgi:hypothetical protein